MPISVGTSLAVIVPTSINSARAHLQRGSVEMDLVKAWALPVVAGVATGALIARYAPAALFKIVFIGICAFTAVRMLGGYTNWSLGDQRPRGPIEWTVGWAICLLCSLMGVGCGQRVNLYMTLYGASIHRAVGTAAAVGTLVAAPGAIGFMLAGAGKAGLPPGSVGFVSLVGFALIAPMATLCAPYGAKIAHSWSKRMLERAFGAFLVLIIGRFVVSLIYEI